MRTASIQPDGLAALPPGLPATRDALQRVAAHVLARRRADVTGRIGLRAAPGGIATPAFGEDVEVLRTDGDSLIIERAGTSAVHRLTALDELAAASGVDLGSPLALGGDPPPIGDPAAPLGIDPASARFLGDWFGFVTTVLDSALARFGVAASPSAIQLWPEHFDLACDVSWGAGEGQRVNLGGSPGDGYHPEPYLYLGPWGPERPGGPGFWNAPFGAVTSYEALRGAGDLAASRAAAVGFLDRGVSLLAAG